MGYGIPPEVLTSAPGLEWVHSGAAGVGSSLGPEMLERDVLFTQLGRDPRRADVGNRARDDAPLSASPVASTWR